MYRISVVAIALALAAVVVGQEKAATQAGELAMSKVTHIGVVVPDMDTAVREYVRVMGFPTPKVNQYPVPMPDGKIAEFKTATMYMQNFFIEVIQPMKPAGPYYDHLQAHGMSIEHVGLMVPGPGNIDAVRRGLEQEGGKWVLGNAGANYAYVDFMPTLGTTLEVNRGATGAPGEPPLTAAQPGDGPAPLAAMMVGHVGFAAADTPAVVSRFAKLLSMTAPPRVMEYKDSQYPPDATWNKSAFLRLSMMNQGGVGIEVIESVGGPTPWSEDVTKHKGTIAQHLAINVGNRIDEMIKDLVAKGGKWTNGKPGGGYAYLDFSKQLGLIFELNGTSKSAAAAK